jgi:hypothetical protein
MYLGTGPSARDLLYPSHPTPCEIPPDRLILRHEEVVGRCAASSLATLSQGVQNGHHSFLYRTILPEAGQKGKAVVDPFGNILGIMYNPHYLEVLSSAQKA